MDTFLTKQDWTDHLAQEVEQERVLREHSAQLRHVELAMFGDAEIPDTVKNALLPTMVRLNHWLDMVGSVWRVSLSSVGGLAAVAVIAKTLGWL